MWRVISYRYQLAYEEMINIVLNCTERKTFNPEIRRGLTPGAKEGAGLCQAYQGYCAISNYGDYIVKLFVFDDQGEGYRVPDRFFLWKHG